MESKIKQEKEKEKMISRKAFVLCSIVLLFSSMNVWADSLFPVSLWENTNVVFKDDYEEVKGEQIIISRDFFAADEFFEYKLSGFFRNGMKKTGVFFFGLIPYDINKKQIELLDVNALPQTDTFLSADCQRNDRTIRIKNASSWNADKFCSVVFGTRNDFSDLPNRNRSPRGIDKIEKSGDDWLVTLAQPCGVDAIKGTGVRLHRDGSKYMFSGAFSQKAPAEWTKYEATVKNFSTKGDTRNSFRIGTHYVKIVVWANYMEGDDVSLQFKRIELSRNAKARPYMISASNEDAKILLLDFFDGTSRNEVAHERSGVVPAKAKFTDSLNGKKFHGAGIVYPGIGNINPQHGTIEMLVSIGNNFGIQNEHLATLHVDNQNAIGLYYNKLEKRIIFYVKTSDLSDGNFHNRNYSTFLVGPSLDWRPGEVHHIAASWSRNHNLIFIDGKAVRWQEYCGSISTQPSEKSRIEIGKNSNFFIDHVRIWNCPVFPERPFTVPRLADAERIYRRKQYRLCQENAEQLNLRCGRIGLSFSRSSILPKQIIDQKNNLLLQEYAGAFLWNEKKIKFHGSLQKNNNLLTGDFRAVELPEVTFGVTIKADQDDAIRMDIKLQNHGASDMQGDFALSLPVLTEKTQAFVSSSGAPFTVKLGNTRYAGSRKAFQVMGEAPQFYLPLMAAYNKEQNSGISIWQDLNVPDYLVADFGADHTPEDMVFSNTKIRIPAGQSKLFTYFFSVHDGDFRASLRKFSSRYPTALFEKQTKLDGGMIIGGPSDKMFLDRMATLQVSYREISIGNGKQIVFGEYVPEHPDQETFNYYKSINAQIENLHRSGILGLVYLQARECKRLELARSKFLESIRIDSNGKIVESYNFGAKMSCRPNSAWFKHLMAQLDCSLKIMPEADGVFFDNAWDKEYGPVILEFGRNLHKRGLLLASNGASAISIAAADSVMSEGTIRQTEALGFLTIGKPLTYVPINPYYCNDVKAERDLIAPALPGNLSNDLKCCLLNGAFYAFNYRGDKHFSPESRRIMSAYLPLQKEMRGKRCFLATRAIEVPASFQTNIYQQPSGNLVAFIISNGVPFSGRVAPVFKVTINPERAIAGVKVRHIESSREIDLPFRVLSDGRVEFEISGHCSISMLKIVKNGEK